jgi:hypothetical protein
MGRFFHWPTLASATIRHGSRSVAFAIAAILSLAPLAAAQEPSFSPATLPAYSPPVPASVFTAGGAADASVLLPYSAVTPLRLSLLSSIYLLGPAFGPGGCGASSVLAAGTILPVQPYAQFALTERLILHGFSDLGCPGDRYAPLDAGVGGGLTYAMPLRPNLWLVGSGGVYGVPPQGVGLGRGAADLRIDLVKRLTDDRTLSVGVGRRSVGISGRF